MLVTNSTSCPPMCLLACCGSQKSGNYFPDVVCLLRGIKVKVKLSRYRSGVVQRVGRVIALLFHDRGTRRG